MRYCCEVYASLYVNHCKWRDHGDWPHGGCEAYGPQHALIAKYPDLLLEDGSLPPYRTKLKPKSSVCPFCNDSYVGRGDMVDQWVELEDATEIRSASRITESEPNMRVGEALMRRLGV